MSQQTLRMVDASALEEALANAKRLASENERLRQKVRQAEELLEESATALSWALLFEQPEQAGFARWLIARIRGAPISFDAFKGEQWFRSRKP